MTLQAEAGAIELRTDTGVFSHGHVDRGTDLLLRTVPPPPENGILVDVGCGYGAIAIAMAARAPAATMYAVDINRRALDLCADNAARNGATNVRAVEPDGVPQDLRADVIYSNPPVRIGKAALQELLGAWLARLVPAGHAYLVMQRNLGADSLARWLRTEGYPATRLRSRMGYRVLDVQHAAATTEDGPR